MPGPVPGVGIKAADWPFTTNLVEGMVHLTVTQGCGLVPAPAGTWNGQPATAIGLAIVATG